MQEMEVTGGSLVEKSKYMKWIDKRIRRVTESLHFKSTFTEPVPFIPHGNDINSSQVF